VDRDKKTKRNFTPRANGARTARNEWLLREVRSRMTKRDELMPERLRRLERMEREARIWVNGQEMGRESRDGYPNDVDG
jgi:hypothetical protein